MAEGYKPLPALVLISPGNTVKAVMARARTESGGLITGSTSAIDNRAFIEPSAADDRVVLWDCGDGAIDPELRGQIKKIAKSFPVVLTKPEIDQAFEQLAAELGAVDAIPHRDLSPAVFRSLLRHVTARRSAERQLQRLALMDQSSGLASQILFWEMLNQAVLRSRRAKDFFSVMLIDFEWIGIPPDQREETVPALFATAARRTRELMRGTDTVARLDKSQISILAVSLPKLEDVQTVAERLVADLTKPIEHGGESYLGRFAIGIALFPTSATGPESLVSRASHALAAAREHGGNSYAFA